MKNKVSLDKLDKFIIYILFIEILFLKWVLIGQDTFVVLLVTGIMLRLLCEFLSKKKSNHQYKPVIMLSLSIIVYIIIDTLLHGTFTYFISNCSKLLMSYIITFYFMFLFVEKGDLIHGVFCKMYKFLNLYYILNLYILIRQLNYSYFLIDMTKTSNLMYEDQIAGLMGLDGTHRLALFTIFIVILNLQMIKEKAVKHTTLCYLYLIITTIIMFYISSHNDNNALYLFLPIVVILYLISNITLNTKNILKAIGLIIIGIGLLLIMIRIPTINAKLEGSVLSKINQFTGIFTGKRIEEERMIYVYYALQNLDGYYFGRGFGQIRVYLDPSIPSIYELRNWGMSNIAPLIAMGGLIFYFSYVYLYALIFKTAARHKNSTPVFFIIMLLLTYYQQVATEVTTMIITCFVMSVIIFAYREKCNTG